MSFGNKFGRKAEVFEKVQHKTVQFIPIQTMAVAVLYFNVVYAVSVSQFFLSKWLPIITRDDCVGSVLPT